MHEVPIECSDSTWRQPIPAQPGPMRAAVLDQVVARIDALGEQRLRVVVDGLTAAGKTSFGRELARGLARMGRPVYRATLDDFKRPWRDRYRYDRESAEGYYRNASDIDALRSLLLDPAAPTGDGVIALCSIDPITQIDHSMTTVAMPANGVLVVDGVFAFRPELDAYWDLRVWLEIDPEVSMRRGVERDAEMDGGVEESTRLHRDRYLAGELLYIAEVDPRAVADVVVDNTDFERPHLLRLDRP